MSVPCHMPTRSRSDTPSKRLTLGESGTELSHGMPARTEMQCCTCGCAQAKPGI